MKDETLTIISKKGGQFKQIVLEQALGHRTSNPTLNLNGNKRNSELSKTGRKGSSKDQRNRRIPGKNRIRRIRRIKIKIRVLATSGSRKIKVKRKMLKGLPEKRNRTIRTTAGQTLRQIMLKKMRKETMMAGETSVISLKMRTTKRRRTRMTSQKLLEPRMEAGAVTITKRMVGARLAGAQREKGQETITTTEMAPKMIHGGTATVTTAPTANETAAGTGLQDEGRGTDPKAVVTIAQTERARGAIMTTSRITIPGEMTTSSRRIPRAGTGANMGHRRAGQGMLGLALAGVKAPMTTLKDGERILRRTTTGRATGGIVPRKSAHGVEKAMSITSTKEAIATVHLAMISGRAPADGVKTHHRTVNLKIILRPRRASSGNLQNGSSWA